MLNTKTALGHIEEWCKCNNIWTWGQTFCGNAFYVWLWLALEHRRQWHTPFAAAHRDNAESVHSSLIESSLSAKNIIDNVNRELEGRSRSLSRAVYTMFNSVFPVISWTLRRSLREACRGRRADAHTQTHRRTRSKAQHRTRLSLHKQRLPVPEWDVRPHGEL